MVPPVILRGGAPVNISGPPGQQFRIRTRGLFPSLTPSITITPSISITPSFTPSSTITPSITPTLTPTVTLTPSTTLTPTPTPTITPSSAPPAPESTGSYPEIEPTYDSSIHWLLDSQSFDSFDSFSSGSTPFLDIYPSGRSAVTCRSSGSANGNCTASYYDYVVGGNDGKVHVYRSNMDDMEELGMVAVPQTEGISGSPCLRIRYGGPEGITDSLCGPNNSDIQQGDLGGTYPEISGPWDHFYWSGWFKVTPGADPTEGNGAASIKGFMFWRNDSGGALRREWRPGDGRYGGNNWGSGVSSDWPGPFWQVGGGWPEGSLSTPTGSQYEPFWKNSTSPNILPPHWSSGASGSGGPYNDGNWHKFTIEIRSGPEVPRDQRGERIWIDGKFYYSSIGQLPTLYDLYGNGENRSWNNNTTLAGNGYDFHQKTEGWAVWGNFADDEDAFNTSEFYFYQDSWIAWTPKTSSWASTKTADWELDFADYTNIDDVDNQAWTLSVTPGAAAASSSVNAYDDGTNKRIELVSSSLPSFTSRNNLDATGKSLKMTWRSGSSCTDQTVQLSVDLDDTPLGSGSKTEMWMEIWAKYEDVWRTVNDDNSCGTGEHKFISLTKKGFGTRFELLQYNDQWWNAGYPQADPVATGSKSLRARIQEYDDPFENNQGGQDLWPGAWHRYRMYMKCSTNTASFDGAYKVWLDSELVVEEHYINVGDGTQSYSDLDQLYISANMNNQPEQDQSLWYRKLSFWLSDPGWETWDEYNVDYDTTREPQYRPSRDVLIHQTNFDQYTGSTVDMGALPLNSGPRWSPSPAPVVNSNPVQTEPTDNGRVKLISGSEARGGSGSALRMYYHGNGPEWSGSQANPAWHFWFNGGSDLTEHTSSIQAYQFWARVIYSGSNDRSAIKFLRVDGPNGQTIQWNTHDRLPCTTGSQDTYWQVYVNNNTTTCQGNQPTGSYWENLVDGLDGVGTGDPYHGWHRYTMIFKSHSASGSLDGFTRMWVDGQKIIDISSGSIGVTPTGGEIPWCLADDVENIPAAIELRYIKLGVNATRSSSPFTFDVDDFTWWAIPWSGSM